MRTFLTPGSSNVASVGYSSQKQLLRVVFRGSTSWYEYTPVPKEVAADIFVCDSIGSALSNIKSSVKAGDYKCVKVEDPKSTPDGKAYWDEVFGVTAKLKGDA